MKKTFIVLIFFALTTYSFAQITFKPGVRAGINLTNITNSGLDNKTDFYIGGFLEIQFADFYALQPELNYSRQGAKNPNAGIEDLEIQYLGLTVVNKFYPFKGLGFHFIIFPSLEFDINDAKTSDNDNSITFIDLAIGTGLGYEFNSGFSIETRIKHGLIDTDIQLFNNNNKDQYNIVFQLGVFYKFKLK